MKKIIIYLIIASLLNLVGCYYQQQMNPEEYKFDENLDLHLTTKDTTYSFNAEDYYYAKDTLYVAESKWIYKGDWVRYKFNYTKIPVKDIEKVEIEKEDVAATTWIVVGAVLVVAATIVIFLTNEKFEKM